MDRLVPAISRSIENEIKQEDLGPNTVLRGLLLSIGLGLGYLVIEVFKKRGQIKL